MNKQKSIFFIFLSLLIAGVFLFPAFRSKTNSAKTAKDYPLEEISNISYYDNPALDSDLTKMNLILPEGAENPPVFMWIGGGAWAYVNRHQEMELCRKIAKQGIAVISIGHRLSPQLLREPKKKEGIKHPEHIKDVAQAFKWVYEHADEYGYAQQNMFMGGFSSGAHLSTLLAADKRYLENLGLSTDLIKAIIPVGGGYDIPHYKKLLIAENPSYEENHINAVFGETHEEHIDASPITYIEDFNTPMLMLTENSTYQYSIVFERLLSERGYDKCEVLNIHSETHASLWRHLSEAEHSIYRNFIVEYIKSKSVVKS